jgi:DNA-binding GntR family transcriptional regulator
MPTTKRVIQTRPARSAPALSPAATRRPREESSVERLVVELRERAMRYDFRPGERINEQALGRELGVSRPPLREALNRLAAEGFLDATMNKGFVRKSISVEEVFNLYQVRVALERRALMTAVRVAPDEEIAAVRAYWAGVMAQVAQAPTLPVGELLLADEEFHRRLAALARNKELSAFLEQVTRRIHIARHIDIEQSAWNARSFDDHAQLVDLLAQRQLEPALAALTDHIDLSLKRAVAITREMVARFFLHGQPPAAQP